MGFDRLVEVKVDRGFVNRCFRGLESLRQAKPIDLVSQRAGLVFHRRCRGRSLFDQGRVLLGHLVKFIDRLTDLSHALALLP